MKRKSVLEAIQLDGHDKDFEHVECEFATGALRGSREKVEAMRQRVENGESLFHPDDMPHGVAQRMDCDPKYNRVEYRVALAKRKGLPQ